MLVKNNEITGRSQKLRILRRLVFGSPETSLIIWIGKPAPAYSVRKEKRDDR